jgi:hypothetical protein
MSRPEQPKNIEEVRSVLAQYNYKLDEKLPISPKEEAEFMLAVSIWASLQRKERDERNTQLG